MKSCKETVDYSITFGLSDGQLILLNENNEPIEPTYDGFPFDLRSESGKDLRVHKITNISVMRIEGCHFDLITCGNRTWKKLIAH